MKLVWDMVGSEFASRHQQYEMFYAGAPFLVRMRMSQAYDFERAEALVDRALGGYDTTGRLSDIETGACAVFRNERRGVHADWPGVSSM
jgi:4-hydroxyphenylacetate 3-monooxygenase